MLFQTKKKYQCVERAKTENSWMRVPETVNREKQGKRFLRKFFYYFMNFLAFFEETDLQ